MEEKQAPDDIGQGTPPLDPSKIQDKLDDFETQLIEREYRFIPVMKEFLNYVILRKGKPKAEPEKSKWIAKKNAAFRALVFSRMRGGGGSGVGGGFLAVLIAIFSLYLAGVANDIAIQSNHLIKTQISVEEATRQATISSELTALLDQINEHQLQQGDSVPLSSSLRGRIITASKMMQPYRLPLPKLDSLSPERGRLLLAALEMQKVSNTPLIYDCDFSYAYCEGMEFRRGSRIDKGQFRLSQMRNTVWTDCDFVECSFLGADLTNAVFENCTFVASDFRGTKFCETSIASCEFVAGDFRGAIIWNSTLSSDFSLKACDFTGALINYPIKDLLPNFSSVQPDSVEVSK